VKVGRPALDDAAIRLIEEQNPDIHFDWPRILDAQPAAPSGEDTRNRRARRDRPRSPAPAGRRPSRSTAMERPPPPAADLTAPGEEGPHVSEIAADEELVEPDSFEPDAAEPDVEQALEELAQPEEDEDVGPPVKEGDEAFGADALTRLRARYTELLARIVERGGDPARVDALRAEAETLNPDAWHTPEDIQKGIESFEPKIRDLRAALGLRRRRRSRRGGRRRRGEGQAAPAPPSSESGDE
jgi:hypothetical protein